MAMSTTNTRTPARHTTGKMLLLERGTLPLSPWFERVDPLASRNFGERSTKSTQHVTTPEHQRISQTRTISTSYRPPPSSSTNPVASGDASMEGTTLECRCHPNQNVRFSPNRGKSRRRMEPASSSMMWPQLLANGIPQSRDPRPATSTYRQKV
jgi:hypothetical protein